MMSGRYKLEGKTAVIVESVAEWAEWMASHNPTVMANEIGDSFISTCFVGINLNPFPSGKPMIFETLVMGGKLDGKRNRYPTWDEAIQGHLQICAQVFRLSNDHKLLE